MVNHFPAARIPSSKVTRRGVTDQVLSPLNASLRPNRRSSHIQRQHFAAFNAASTFPTLEQY
jgi:hypothetical protein